MVKVFKEHHNSIDLNCSCFNSGRPEFYLCINLMFYYLFDN